MCALHIVISARESVFRRRRAFGPRRQIFVKGLVGILKRGIKIELFIICERPRETYLSALLYIVCVLYSRLYHSLMHMTKGRCNKGHSSC